MRFCTKDSKHKDTHKWIEYSAGEAGYWNSDVLLDPQKDPETENEVPSRFVTDVTAGL